MLSLIIVIFTAISDIVFQILVQVKDVLSKLPSLVEITLKEVTFFRFYFSAITV